MKQICNLFLILTMILSMFSGCSNEKSKESETVVAAEATEEETTEPIVQEETSEIQLLLGQVWVPENMPGITGMK